VRRRGSEIHDRHGSIQCSRLDPGTDGDKQPSGKWSPVRQKRYSPSSSPIFVEPSRTFETGRSLAHSTSRSGR
jgi:hypothetical protein